MIKNILDLLALDEFYGQSDNIEIAKGKFELIDTWGKAFKQLKRQWKIR